tara:strand:+ start:454 stop:2025 length:1572 start_codon:yes stop_codon:yes gene_type:complete
MKPILEKKEFDPRDPTTWSDLDDTDPYEPPEQRKRKGFGPTIDGGGGKGKGKKGTAGSKDKKGTGFKQRGKNTPDQIPGVSPSGQEVPNTKPKPDEKPSEIGKQSDVKPSRSKKSGDSEQISKIKKQRVLDPKKQDPEGDVPADDKEADIEGPGGPAKQSGVGGLGKDDSKEIPFDEKWEKVLNTCYNLEASFWGYGNDAGGPTLVWKAEEEKSINIVEYKVKENINEWNKLIAKRHLNIFINFGDDFNDEEQQKFYKKVDDHMKKGYDKKDPFTLSNLNQVIAFTTDRLSPKNFSPEQNSNYVLNAVRSSVWGYNVIVNYQTKIQEAVLAKNPGANMKKVRKFISEVIFHLKELLGRLNNNLVVWLRDSNDQNIEMKKNFLQNFKTLKSDTFAAANIKTVNFSRLFDKVLSFEFPKQKNIKEFKTMNKEHVKKLIQEAFIDNVYGRYPYSHKSGGEEEPTDDYLEEWKSFCLEMIQDKSRQKAIEVAKILVKDLELFEDVLDAAGQNKSLGSEILRKFQETM